jgi:hypothetical protein
MSSTLTKVTEPCRCRQVGAPTCGYLLELLLTMLTLSVYPTSP